MKARLIKIVRWVAYPLFYLFCLALFGYLTFPFDALKTRIIAEFDRMQQLAARKSPPENGVMRLEIDEIDSYWLSGVEVVGARLIIPPKAESKRKSPMAFGSPATESSEPPKATVVTIDRVTARLQILPLLVGDVQVDFDAEAFGGEISGSLPVGADNGDVEMTFEGLQMIDIAPLQNALEGVPLQGVAAGNAVITPKEGKFGKADGHLHVSLETVKLGKQRKNDEGAMEDVVELQGVALPSVLIGTVTIDATIKDGVLTIDDFGSKGADFELAGEGKVRLSETWERAKADMYLKFKFSDAYRTKSDAATSLLGKPGQSFPPAIEAMPTSPFRRAKTDDDFYRFQISGPLAKIDFKPAGKASSGRTTTKGGGAPAFGSKTSSRLKLPVRKPRTDAAGEDDKEEADEKPAAPEPAEQPEVEDNSGDEKAGDGEEQPNGEDKDG